MVTTKSYVNGQFCWVDLMARDADAAKAFYGELLGWEAQEQDTKGGPRYSCFALDGLHVAGLGEMSDEMKASGMPCVWNSYIRTDDVEATTQSAVKYGATIQMPPLPVVDAGIMSIIQTPTGEHVCFWQEKQHCGAQAVNDPGCWVWNELLMRDPEQAKEFYSNLFGWAFKAEETPAGTYWYFTNQGRVNGGMMQLPAEVQNVPSYWSAYFAVADVQQATARVKELGGTVIRDPFEVSVGHISVVLDPQGAVFNLIQMTVPVDQAPE